MDQAERERRHRARLERINDVQLIVGRGDRLRIDHEGTLMERARMMVEEISAHEATERGLLAFERLLRLAEESQAGQARAIGEFIAAVWDHQPLPLVTLRGLEPAVGDDMLAVLDAFRHARLDLAAQVEGGPARVCRLLDRRRLACA